MLRSSSIRLEWFKWSTHNHSPQWSALRSEIDSRNEKCGSLVLKPFNKQRLRSLWRWPNNVDIKNHCWHQIVTVGASQACEVTCSETICRVDLLVANRVELVEFVWPFEFIVQSFKPVRLAESVKLAEFLTKESLDLNLLDLWNSLDSWNQFEFFGCVYS